MLPCKGQKAIWVLAPSFSKKTERDDDHQDDDDKADRKPIYFRPVAVFDVSQTAGEPLPQPTKKLDGDTCGDLFTRLVTFSRDNGCPVTVRDFDGVCNGYYDPAKHEITVRSGLSPDQQVKTLAHELAHSILHRDIEVYRAHRADCETEAESVSFIVLHHFGCNSGSYTFGYIASWQSGDEKAIKALKSCAQRVQSTAKRIIDAVTEEEDTTDVDQAIAMAV